MQPPHAHEGGQFHSLNVRGVGLRLAGLDADELHVLLDHASTESVVS